MIERRRRICPRARTELSTRSARRTQRRAALLVAAAAAALGLAAPAAAAPAGGSASVQVGGGKPASASSSSSGKKSKYDWPEVVLAGNAVSFLAPLQFGLVGYLPKARFAFQYDRQIRKGHWFHLGVGALFDRGDWKNFRQKSCGIDATGNGICNEGGVVGVDVYAGYTYRFYLAKKPWFVPYVRGTIGYSFFDLPTVGGGEGNFKQARIHTSAVSIRPGGGFRIFPWEQLGFGMDLALPIGFLVHRERPDPDQALRRRGGFLLGLEVLPIVVEFRF
ncbi:MAG: hypothetical protein K1X88_23130 [Nannocystaceae bacterium]|nr:hypothetical protein [Nannocystaceae bacterium]